MRLGVDHARRTWNVGALLTLALWSIAGGAGNGQAALDSTRPPTALQERSPMWMSVGTQRFAVIVEDNATARALVQLLPVTLDMAELNGNEKHGRLPHRRWLLRLQHGVLSCGLSVEPRPWHPLLIWYGQSLLRHLVHGQSHGQRYL
jgi:hypothetical protein